MTKQEFKQKCVELRRQNYTLGEMVKLLERPKTTIFFHIQNIPKCKVLRDKISAKSRSTAAKARSAPGATKKGVSILDRHCKEFEVWTPDLVNLVGHVAFDGNIDTSGVRYHNRSLSLIDNFRKKMKAIYSYDPGIYKKSGGVITLGYHNVELASLFRIKKKELLREISLFSKEFQLEFLRAFFDDEGSVDFRKNIRRIRGYQHNSVILFLVQKILKNFSIDSIVSERFNEVVIGKQKDIKKFAELVNFSAGVRVNGQRSNSIWKKSLEKREILKMAVASYL